MSKDTDKPTDKRRARAVPTSRVGRFARVARLAGGVAGGMLAEGGRQWRAGKRPKAKDLLLTPGNARRVAEQLADMRGAAMKLGQILSMDTGDLLPRELADILARLRADAHYMPPQQLETAMASAYGEGWRELFYGFDDIPLAAASIGQVHRAYAPDGRDIVLKIQYPGVAESIDSDVDNIATVLGMTGLLPASLDLAPLLQDAKAQLKDEADYRKEAKFLTAFGEALTDDERFVVPQLLPEFSHRHVLVMSYEPGREIEALAAKPRKERDRVCAALFELMLTELFELRLVQTDPNFANYQYRAGTGEIVLLDFGATRRFKAAFSRHYRQLAAAAIADDEPGLVVAAEKLGYAVGEEDSAYQALVVDLFMLALEPLRTPGAYDFAASDLAARMSALGETISGYSDFWQAPPIDAVYFHRKLGGMFMLATRLEARVDVHALMRRWL